MSSGIKCAVGIDFTPFNRELDTASASIIGYSQTHKCLVGVIRERKGGQGKSIIFESLSPELYELLLIYYLQNLDDHFKMGCWRNSQNFISCKILAQKLKII